MCSYLRVMLNFIRACFLLLLLIVNVIIIATPIVLLYFVGRILVWSAIRRVLFTLINRLYVAWLYINYAILYLVLRKRWHFPQQRSDLNTHHWYVMIANHRSWFDILLINCAFVGYISPPKFFMKRELLWSLPFGAWACYALGFPFLRRHTRAQIRKKPDLKNTDIEMVRRACDQFKKLPTTSITFVEGTRFTKEKHERQKSPYKHLLMPRAAGVAVVLHQLAPILDCILDVSLHYSQPASLWKVLNAKVDQITVCYRKREITSDLCADYYTDRNFRSYIQKWLNEVWQEKDSLIDAIMEQQRVRKDKNT